LRMWLTKAVRVAAFKTQPTDTPLVAVDCTISWVAITPLASRALARQGISTTSEIFRTAARVVEAKPAVSRNHDGAFRCLRSPFSGFLSRVCVQLEFFELAVVTMPDG